MSKYQLLGEVKQTLCACVCLYVWIHHTHTKLCSCWCLSRKHSSNQVKCCTDMIRHWWSRAEWKKKCWSNQKSDYDKQLCIISLSEGFSGKTDELSVVFITSVNLLSVCWCSDCWWLNSVSISVILLWATYVKMSDRICASAPQV